ncbi:MAG: hypothetical protein FWE33_07320 [Defluviitaleaceae bacterium]|nr:hypothetical protein [Defluviitaleaceae bacterium]
MKKLTILLIAVVFVFILAACGGDVGQGENNPDGGTFAIEDIQNNPNAYLGEIILTGIVGTVSARDFTLENEAGTFDIVVEYRGSQALPRVGDKVTIEGMLVENPPCCGGFTLTTTRFEIAE